MTDKDKNPQSRGSPKVLVGIVSSDKMTKTIVVKVERYFRHPKYGKYIRRYTVCKAHDEKEEARRGDKVEIMETRPLSKTKSWRLVRIVERVKTPEELAAAAEAPKKS